MNFDVRKAEPAEFVALGDLTAGAYAGQVSDDYLEELRNVADRAQTALVLVAVDPVGTVAGGVTYVGPGQPSGAHEAGIRMLAVAPEFRRRGVGSALVNACIERARGDGADRVILYTKSSMTAAHRLYQSLEFLRTQERDCRLPSGANLMSFVLELNR